MRYSHTVRFSNEYLHHELTNSFVRGAVLQPSVSYPAKLSCAQP